ncbi:MAG TPA: hypothetical protein VGF58_00730 [Burkholderiales bacterium]
MARSSTLLVAVLAACATTTANFPYRVNGETPQAASCEVVVAESATGRVLQRTAVTGRFSLDYNAGGLFPRVDVAAYCGGAKVKELKNLALGSEREVDLGKLEP